MTTLNGRTTSRLGFGGSFLGSTSAAESERILHAAFDAGIRHFDVAPMYGFGKAEKLLGQSFRGRTDEITITTKYGLEPPKNAELAASLHRMARVLLKNVPAVKRRLQNAAKKTVSAGISAAPLTAAEARVSLQRSLGELGVERVDLYLLHEATPERLSDPGLLEFLEESKLAGKIGQFGVGSESHAALACLRQKPEYCSVIQTEWSVFTEAQSEFEGRPRIQHGSLGGRRGEFLEWLESDKARRAGWSESTGTDLSDARVIHRLMFRAALLHAPENIVLFSTKNIQHILDNVRIAEDATQDAAALIFQRLVQDEFVAVQSL